MNEEKYNDGLDDNIRDAVRDDIPFEMTRLEVTRAFLSMGQTDDLWEHTGVPMETIREILVQAHNYIVIG